MRKKQIQALILSFSGVKNTQIAAEVGVNERTIQTWKNKPEWKDLEALMGESIVAESAGMMASKISLLVSQSLDFLEQVLTDESDEVSIKNKLQASNQILSLLRYQKIFNPALPEESSKGLSDQTIDVIKAEILGLTDGK